MRIIWNMLSFIFNFVPFIMVGYAWYMLPMMKLPIGTGEAPFEWIAYSLGIAIVWLFVQCYISSNRNTSVGMLQLDAVQGILFSFIFALASGWFIAKGGFPWFMAVPLGMTFLDALISSFLAINNAAQKPLVGGAASQGNTLLRPGNDF